MNCFSCCMSEQREARKSLKKSIQEYKDTKNLASFANISFKSDSSKRRYIAEEIAKIGKGNVTAQIFSFHDLSTATQNFNPDSLVGEGGFGRVYRGRIESLSQAQPLFKDKRKFLINGGSSVGRKLPLEGSLPGSGNRGNVPPRGSKRSAFDQRCEIEKDEPGGAWERD
ncbi:protein kinase superfamily protein [Actinidia rufa]|uniref:Protein kinase superfamily protein n=1 Tax=Actinidia rufa TaxID=165716 RepID=A0A7J0GNY9_9ERIC|nr:protein kinase superfamily protein [Actinidia rufa]